MAQQYMLTTVDNPYNPFTHYSEWYRWDVNAGYNSAGLLARIAKHSDELSEPDQDAEIERAITEIVRENVTGVYRKVASPNSNS